MQSVNNINNLFSPNNLKCVEVNSLSTKNIDTKGFANGIQNARNLLNNLEKSVRKSSKYEEKLIQCKSNHYHIHDVNEWWDTDVSYEDYNCSKEKASRNQVDMSNSLSTMSIVYLQCQYEELSKQYESLLQAYKERCIAVNIRDSAITKLRHRLKLTHARIIHAHKALLSVGDKYLALKRKKNDQKHTWHYEINKLKEMVCEVFEGSQKAGLEFDMQLAHYLSEERNSDGAMLLTEMRKCNQLHLENLRLKTKLTINTVN